MGNFLPDLRGNDQSHIRAAKCKYVHVQFCVCSKDLASLYISGDLVNVISRF